MSEPLPIQKDAKPILSVVQSAQDLTLAAAEKVLECIETHGLRNFDLAIAAEEEQLLAYYLPKDPKDYGSNVGLASCIGQTSVTVADWYEDKTKPFHLKPWFPSWYLKDEFNKWRNVAVIEFTDYSLTCAKEIPIRDEDGKPKLAENGKFIKIPNPFKDKYGLNFYRKLAEDRFEQHQANANTALAVIPDRVQELQMQRVKEVIPITNLGGDDSWLRQNPDFLKTLSALQTSFGGGGAAAIASSMYQKESDDYLQTGRLLEMNLLNKIRAGRLEVQQLIGLDKEVLLQMGLTEAEIKHLKGE